MHPCQSKCHTFCLAAVYVSYSVTSPIIFPLGNHDTNLAILCVFTCVHPPGDYHTWAGINIDLGATIGAKSDEGTEAPV